MKQFPKNRTRVWETFNDRVKKDGPLGCWEWLGHISIYGYGVLPVKINNKVKRYKAHRLAFELMYGDMINENQCVCHTCDNKKCVNPLHLFLGSNKDNYFDSYKKGRHSRGSKVGTSKLKEKEVLEIRELISKNTKTDEIAKMFNVSRSAITLIKSNINWRWL